MARLCVLGSEQFPKAQLEEVGALRRDNLQGQIIEHVFGRIESILFFIFQKLFAGRAFLKIGKYHSRIPGGIFRRV